MKHLPRFLMAGAALLGGCLNGSTVPTGPGNDVLIVDPIADQSLFLDPLWVSDAWLEGNELKLQVSYSGGCEDHVVHAYAPDRFSSSGPRVLSVFLRHDAADDACEAIVHETLSFDVNPAGNLHRELFGDDGLFYFEIHTFSSPGDPSPRVLYYSGNFLSPREDVEAEHMALVLGRELVAPQDLYDRVRGDLEAIRDAYGDERTEQDRPLSTVGFRAPWRPGELVVELDPESAELARRGLYTAWNDLNTVFGIENIQVFPSLDFVHLVFSVQFHPCEVVEWYLSLPGVLYAGPNRLAGDAPNIFPLQVENGLTYVFREAWGDCPAGCINSDFWYFERLNSNTEFLGRFNPRVHDPPPPWWEEADRNLWFYNQQSVCFIR